MNNQPLAHEDAMVLTAGSLPRDRPDLEVLAAAIVDFRAAFADPAPQPSPRLVGWLTGSAVPQRHDIAAPSTQGPPVHAQTIRMRSPIRAAVRALAGLGVTAKIALGGTAALAAVAAAGAVDVLPEGPQAVYDRIVDNAPGDATTPRAPDPAADRDTRLGTGADTGSGEPPRNEQASPVPEPLAPQDESSSERAEDATGDRPRSVGKQAPRPGTDDSSSFDDDRRGEQDDQSDDEDGGEPGHDSDELDDDSAIEPDDEFSDDPVDESDDEPDFSDERGHLGDEEMADTDDSSAEVQESPEEPGDVNAETP